MIIKLTTLMINPVSTNKIADQKAKKSFKPTTRSIYFTALFLLVIFLIGLVVGLVVYFVVFDTKSLSSNNLINITQWTYNSSYYANNCIIKQNNFKNY